MQVNVRNMFRLFSLGLIFALWFSGKITVWSILLLAGLLITPLLGRIYCGWVCPVFTTLDIFAPLTKKPILKKYDGFLENKIFQILIFVFFVLAFILTRKFKLSVPFFIMLIPLGLAISILFGPSRWHHICPFGTIFSLPARFSKYGYTFNSQDCSKCGLCVKKCENNCLHFGEVKSLYIERKHCLTCGKCQDACKQHNITFGKLNKEGRVKKKAPGGTAL